MIYSALQLNEVQNQGFTNQIILLPPASCLLPRGDAKSDLPPASKPVTLCLMQKKTAVIPHSPMHRLQNLKSKIQNPK
ncbi:hypothetical protein CK516_10065 [Nostoc sp. 'Peltigera malacea cyanobiont' DB3992]|nr:hypothetical protein CK516_10065 [Nostoc sp. 'Peltigera malacea cyanobiont' DB3992]